MSSSQNRKGAGRASLPRRTTRGPLEEDDPLSVSSTTFSSSSPTASSLKSPPITSPTIPTLEQQNIVGSDASADEIEIQGADADVGAKGKDLSFLLDAAIYHPLSNMDVPATFRKSLPGIPKANHTLQEVIPQISALIGHCDFLGAAHLAATCLTSGNIEPTDSNSIFTLLAVRYSCLELSGNLALAAQEAKALEDLMSSFYYVGNPGTEAKPTESSRPKPLPKHIMPFPLRIQAIRLQNMGFSDPRRGVATLYDLGSECREHIASPFTTAAEKQVWAERLDELGIRVVNALIELGDLDCALRTMAQLKPSETTNTPLWVSRMVLLHLKAGNISEARALINQFDLDDGEKAVLTSLIAISEDRLIEAVNILSNQKDSSSHGDLLVLAQQNLAVAFLYIGKIHEARDIMEKLVREGHSFQSLTINLATIYDLTSDNSRDLKSALVNTVATKTLHPRAFTNADFKL